MIKMKYDKVAFLDVDGVLNNNSTTEVIPGTNYCGIDDYLVERLSRVIRLRMLILY